MAPKRNGFWYFMMEYKKQAEAKGKSFPGGIRDVQVDPECSQQWSALSDEQKRKYNQQAKGGGDRPKLTTWGEPIADVEARAKKRAEFEENMRRDIEETVQLAAYAKKIPELPFFFIHVNYFYAKDGIDGSVTYVPAEIAICEFSIEDGCKKFYHQIINIDVELGYRRELIEHAEDTHKLEPDCENGEKDYTVILKKFQAFLERERIRTGKMPPVYTTKRHSPVVKCFLDRLAVTADSANWKGNRQIADLYTLEILFGKLMAVTNADLAQQNCNPALLAEAELEKSAFDHAPNIECEFHQKIEGVAIHCSLAIIRQWIFMICDYCCPRLGVKMLKEVHCPADVVYDDVDLLVTHLTNADLTKERKIGYVKSATGVTQAHRESRAGRTPAEEEQRRREAMRKPLTIVDHSELRLNSSRTAAAASSETCQAVYTKPLRLPKPPPKADEDDVPPPRSAGRGSHLKARLLAERGRGRGRIRLDN